MLLIMGVDHKTSLVQFLNIREVEVLNGLGWHVIRQELDRPNLELARTVPNSACNRSYWVGGSYEQV